MVTQIIKKNKNNFKKLDNTQIYIYKIDCIVKFWG